MTANLIVKIKVGVLVALESSFDLSFKGRTEDEGGTVSAESR